MFITNGSGENFGPMYLLMNEKEIITPNQYNISSNLYYQNIIGLRNNDKKHYYITVVCPEECKGNLTYYASNYIHIDHF